MIRWTGLQDKLQARTPIRSINDTSWKATSTPKQDGGIVKTQTPERLSLSRTPFTPVPDLFSQNLGTFLHDHHQPLPRNLGVDFPESKNKVLSISDIFASALAMCIRYSLTSVGSPSNQNRSLRGVEAYVLGLSCASSSSLSGTTADRIELTYL